jgi:hypothetical protein
MTASSFDVRKAIANPKAGSSFPTREGEAAGRRGDRCRPGSRGESGKLMPPDVKAGDFIVFGKWSGTEVRIGEDLLIMKESDIMGIVEKAGMAVNNAP